jgi:transcriptional regulator with XRE-family HTH domain
MSVNVGKKVRKIRELKGFTQEYLAEQLGISQRAYSKLERDEVKMSWDKIVAISRTLEVRPEDLVTFNEETIFNFNSQSGGQSGKIENLVIQIPEKLIEQYESRISELQEEIKFLRGLVNKTNE